MIQTRPLLNKSIVLTRHLEGTSRMAERLQDLGAEVLEIPLIEVVSDLDEAGATEIFKEFASYEWLLFTSRNGVKHFFEAFLKTFEDIRALGLIRIGAVGQGTAEELAHFHLKPDLIPSKATARHLAAELAAFQSLDNLKILVITGNRNRQDLVKDLWESRAIVDTLRVYATHFTDLSHDPGAACFRKEGADAVVFASASAVQAFGDQARHLTLAKGARTPALCSFGPTTSQCMKKAGIPIAVEAESPGQDGMIEALVAYFADQA